MKLVRILMAVNGYIQYYNGSSYVDFYPYSPISWGVVNEAADVRAKTATVNNFYGKKVGAVVNLLFPNGSTINAPTLNINGSGAALIGAMGNPVISPNFVVTFVYDGTYWNTVGHCAQYIYPARSFITNLSSTSAPTFNNSSNMELGVKGILPVAYGGTGTNSLTTLKTNLGLSSTAQIQTGSYTGTNNEIGTMTLNFNIPVKAFFLSSNESQSTCLVYCLNNQSKGIGLLTFENISDFGKTRQNIKYTFSNNNKTLKIDAYYISMLNKQYNWLAIG